MTATGLQVQITKLESVTSALNTLGKLLRVREITEEEGHKQSFKGVSLAQTLTEVQKFCYSLKAASANINCHARQNYSLVCLSRNILMSTRA